MIIKRTWYVIDATDKVLGRLASAVVKYLIGKHKTEYAPYKDVGDYIIVVNAKNILISGKKKDNKVYYRHTGYPGGIRSVTFKQMMNLYPNRIIEIAIKGMLPKNVLGRLMFKRLRVYANESHRHIAQSPKSLSNI